MQKIFLSFIFVAKTLSLLTDQGQNIMQCFQSCKSSQQNDLLVQFGCFQQCEIIHRSKNQQQKKTLEVLKKKFSDLPDNYCLEGRNPMSYKDKLKMFAQGPCSPLMLAPGTLATKLRVEIDCEVLQKENPEQFSNCGWTHCKKSFYEFWKTVPKQEYNLWINDLLSNVNFFGSYKSNMCFVGFFKNKFNFKSSPQKWIHHRKGFKVKVYGFTNETKSENKCGSNAIKDLLPLPIQIKATKDFRYIIQEIERLGYTSGLTYQAMPYNFYNSLFQNEFTKNFKKQVLRLNQLVGKKITIVAHSNGNLLTLYNLHSSFTQEQKEKYFRNFISLGAPFLGAYQASRYLLAGDSDLVKLDGLIGLKWKASKEFMNNQSSLYLFLTKDYRKLYQNESWFAKIEQRLKYEKDDSISFENSGINFWPKKDQICYKENESDFSRQCLLDFEDSSENFVQIGQEFYGTSNFSQALQKYSKDETVTTLYKQLSQTNIGLINPGIPTFLVFESLEKTDYKFNFHNFEQDIRNDNYPTFDRISYTRGDGTVQSSSTLLPALRWALKSDEGDLNYKKVTFVELCSIVNKDTPIFDGQDEDGSKIFTQNRYMGIDCDCETSNDYKDCVHSDTISDANFVKLVTKVLDVKEKCSDQQINYIDQLEEQFLKDEVEKCTHYESDIFVQASEENSKFESKKQVKKIFHKI